MIVSRAVAEQAGFAGVRLMVAGRPPHKPGDPALIPAEHRVAMCRLAVAGDPFFEVDDRETQREGPSYTIETARELQTEPPFAGRPVPWLIGADLLNGLMSWREPQRLLAGDVVRLMVIGRAGRAIDWPALPRELRMLEANVIDGPRIDISATDVRRRVRQGRDIRYLVPEAVRAYIQQHSLYR